MGASQAVDPSLRVEVRPADPGNSDDIGRALSAHASTGSGGGLIVTSSQAGPYVNRELIVGLAARFLPATYAFRVYVAGGGLMSYGSEPLEPYRGAADYIDRRPFETAVLLPGGPRFPDMYRGIGRPCRARSQGREIIGKLAPMLALGRRPGGTHHSALGTRGRRLQRSGARRGTTTPKFSS